MPEKNTDKPVANSPELGVMEGKGFYDKHSYSGSHNG
jgi:hypothetical protein